MLDFIDELPHKFQFVLVALLIIVTFALLSLLATEIKANQPHKTSGAAAASTSFVTWGSSPNMVANGLGAAAGAVEQTTSVAGTAVANGANAVGTAFVVSGRFVAHGPEIVLRGLGGGLLWSARTVGSGLFFAARIVGSSVLFVLNIPVHIMGFVFDTPVVSALIRPDGDAKVPIIDANAASMFTPTVLAAKTTTTHTAVKKISTAVHWPIHGAVTTLFGVPEWPYEAVHTGVDISDGAAPGVTLVHAFKAGKVIATIYTPSLGLGNHVIIDHGDGMTSVYGHLNSISVKVGQMVTTSTVVGYEGTTGVSTGTHLHFEIRINGVAVNPMKYIPGQP